MNSESEVKTCVWFCLWTTAISLLASSCATTSSQRLTIDVRAALRDSRIVIAPVPFYLREDTGLTVMQPDQRFASIIVSTLEAYLQEKGHPAFFAGRNLGLLTQPEVAFLFAGDSRKLIDHLAQNTKFFDLDDPKKPSFEQVGKILFPVVVVSQLSRGTALLSFLLHPGAIDMTVYAFLVDAQTGEVQWNNRKQMVANYNAIDLELRGLRWGHGLMWDLLETFR